MQKLTVKEIEAAITELKEAMLDKLECDLQDEHNKLEQIKAQKRLVLAKEAIRNLNQ